MVDFNKLREQKNRPTPIDPIEIFRRLPKPEAINDLYISQAEILKGWFDRRNEESLVIKLHTGGGKTLVGLLIAQSSINETNLPALYLCSTRQLVEQTYLKSQEYGIPAVKYETGGGIPLADDFLAAKKVMICTYEALFNGRSKFGVVGTGKPAVKVGAIILDDAHVAYSRIRDAFTIKIAKDSNDDDFSYVTNIFRKDFDEIGKLGLFDDTISGREQFSVLEVPYWSWLEHIPEVREYIRKDADKKYPFAWPYLRDNLEYSQALVSREAFVITTYFPVVDSIPTYTTCARKAFMSATIADDSSIVRTFDIDKISASQPLTSTSLAGVSERMILMPEWMGFDDDFKEILMNLANWSANEKRVGTVILTPSFNIAAGWSEIGQIAETRDRVTEFILNLQNGKSKGPYVFANRYDGIDLPGDACRLLIFANMPRGANEYENYLANLFEGSSLNNTLAQKIEQGIGRGARGTRDYCVVLIFGKDVLSWIANRSNSRFLTGITRAQIEIGKTISEDIHDNREFLQTILTCLERNHDWIRFHAETLAELTETDPVAIDQLSHASIEREAFRLWRDANYEKAISKLHKYSEQQKNIDKETKGWILQFAARIAYAWKNHDLSIDLQKQAFSFSRNLFRPKIIEYTMLSNPGQQAHAITSQIMNYRTRRGHLSKFDEMTAHMVPEASSNQFEQALADFGSFLGFATERPEKSYGVGPDVLWLLNINLAWVIEVKSRKEGDNPLTKANHGQLLNAEQWFRKEYPAMNHIRIIVSPNRLKTKNTIVGDSKVLTFDKLNSLLHLFRSLLLDLCNSVESDDQLVNLCEQLLVKYELTPSHLGEIYLQDFE